MPTKTPLFIHLLTRHKLTEHLYLVLEALPEAEDSVPRDMLKVFS